jgi:predicted RNase H-like nuclease (RuvC/YqgF family)
MNYTDIINQVVAEAIDREVKDLLAAKDDEIASLKGLLGDRDREVAKLIDDISELKRKDYQNAPLDGDAVTQTYGTSLMSAVHVLQKSVDTLRSDLSAANAVVDTVKTLPTWKDQDLAEWKGSETEAAIFCLREFMLSVGASTAKDLENGLEKAQGASSSGGDRELVALRGDILERGHKIESLQAELNGVRDALKKHVDSEEKVKKELDGANARITELDAMVDERDTRIEELDGKIEEKDNLIEKYKDMADAISDWANNDMPSLDPDDY